MFDWLHEIDGSVLLWIQEHIRMEWLNDIVIFITRLGNPGITWMILLAILLLVKRTRNTGKCALLALVCSFVINNLILKTAEENETPFQYASIAAGGTDSGSIHLTANGVPALSIGIATRYIHSHAGIIHEDDFDNAVKLIVEVIKQLDKDTVHEITFD